MNKVVEIPTLETDRLVLRAARFDDFAPFAETRANPEVVRFIGGKPLSEEESWAKFLRSIGLWQFLGYGYWTAVERSSNKPIGEVGFGDFKRDMIPSVKGEPEIGWIIDPSAQGKGYASEAALAAVAWGDRHFKGLRMSCIIDAANEPSLRVAQKCGFEKTCTATYHDDEIVLLHRQVP